MCGRIRLTTDFSELNIPVRIPSGPAVNCPARWNGAPTQGFSIVRRNSETAALSFDFLWWGLIRAWAKDEKSGCSTINAKAVTSTRPTDRRWP